MNITFHGAARTVTGSKHLLTLPSGKKLLLDCGMFQGMGSETNQLNESFGFEPKDVDYMILSHAHIDHSGLIPRLTYQGYRSKIYAIDATKSLANVLLEDSANIHESDVNYENKRRKLLSLPLLKPLYTKQDAQNSIKLFETVAYDAWTEIEDGVSFQLTDTGHIIGSSSVHIKVNDNGTEKIITFSGDVGRYNDMILPGPTPFLQSDYIIIESTYGNTLHEAFPDTANALLEWINYTCVSKKGRLILPAFSLGRTQELLYILNGLSNQGKLPKIKFFVDSPLGEKITQITKQYPQYFNNTVKQLLQSDKDPFDFEGLVFTESVDDSKRLNYYNKPCVIISSSGMAEAGRVKHHISNAIENDINSIVLTGYASPNSLGGKLVKKPKPKEVMIYGMPHEVNADIGQLRSMSAHGDYKDLLHFINNQAPEKVKQIFLVHGEYEVQQDFRNTLQQNGYKNISIPDMHQTFEL